MINGKPQWEVERMRASRVHSRKRTLEYQVSWQGLDPDDEWYPAENFKNAAARLESFHNDYPNAAGPPKRLEIWKTAAAEDRDDPEHAEDNVAVHEALNKRAKRLPRRH